MRFALHFISQVIWDEAPTMVEIAIFCFQIHITNGLKFHAPEIPHRKPKFGYICNPNNQVVILRPLDAFIEKIRQTGNSKSL